MHIVSTVAYALEWDFDGDGLINPFERGVIILVGIAAILTALFLIAKYVRRGFRRLRIWFRSINHLIQAIQEFLDDWRGTPSEGGVPATPGIMQRMHMLESNQTTLMQRQGEIADVAIGVAKAQETTATEVTARFDRGSEKMDALAASIAATNDRVCKIETKVTTELSPNGGSSIKDNVTKATADAEIAVREVEKIKKSLILAEIMDPDEDDD